MKRLDIYIIRQFLVTLSMTLLGFLCIILIVDLIENLDRFIDNGIPPKITIKYYVYAIPWFLNIGLPMSMLISTVFSLGLLAKRNELTAMKATGISLYRIAIPITTIGLIVSFISFELDNTWVSKGNEVRFNIEREYMKRRSRIKAQKELNNVFLQKYENTHISIGRYKVETRVGRSITVISLEKGIVTQRMDARSAEWIDSLEAWKVNEFSIRTFNKAGEVSQMKISEKDTLLGLNFSPYDITQQSKTPDEMNFNDLTARIEQLKANGVDTTKWEVDRLFKISFAFTNLIVVLFGLPLVVMKSKGGLSFGAGMGIFVIFVYYAFIKFGMSMGYNGVMSPLVSAWMGNVIFSAGGLLLLVFARK